MPNFPGPYVITFEGTVDGQTHTYAINLKIDGDPSAGTPETSISTIRRDLSLVNVNTALQALIDLYKVRFPTDYAFGGAQLWKVADQSFEKQFISTLSANALGTNAGSVVLAHYSMYTFRTQEGGLMKLTHLEDVEDSKNQRTYAELGGGEQALVDFIISDQNWVLAYDTSYPIGFIRGSYGENEALFRKRYRDS